MNHDSGYKSYVRRTLRETRTKSGLSLRQLGKLASTSHATLSNYERGIKSPSAVVFLRILEACGFAVVFTIKPRIRFLDGIRRGDELADVLSLAGRFPAKHSKEMQYPLFRKLSGGKDG